MVEELRILGYDFDGVGLGFLWWVWEFNLMFFLLGLEDYGDMLVFWLLVE